MWRSTAIGAIAITLAACAGPSATAPDLAAKNRPLEERCVRAHPASSEHRPELSRAQVQAEARDAARRGELDKACDWL